MIFPSITEFSFDASLWSSNEYSKLTAFKIQYEKNGEWIDHISYNLKDFSTDKDNMLTYNVLLPSYSNNIRFYAYTPSPTTSYNKSRICLDNICFKYDKLLW